MFGYVRPLRGALRVCELEYYKAAYCGLCHALKREYGLAARFLINYDFAFLTLCLSLFDETPPDIQKCRCIASPLRRKTCLRFGSSASRSADLAVLLSRGKLRDTVADEPFFSSLPARIALLFLEKAGKKAEKRRPETQNVLVESLTRLAALETDKIPAIDPPADTFAGLLSVLGQSVEDPNGRRTLSQLFYHLGRWIYLMDACDDLKDDARRGRYNPVAQRFGLSDGQLPEETKQALAQTADLSEDACLAAFYLLPQGPATPILENVLLLGLPHVQKRVLDGTWNQKSNRHGEQ